MSLQFYVKKPDNVQTIISNDTYFDAHTNIPDTELGKRILKEIDGAEYISPNTYQSNYDGYGPLDKQCLSTGTKTLFNIMQNPQICFNLTECGINVLKLLPFIHNGMVYADEYVPILTTEDNLTCDITVGEKHFTDILKFSEYYDEVFDNEYTDKL